MCQTHTYVKHQVNLFFIKNDTNKEIVKQTEGNKVKSLDKCGPKQKSEKNKNFDACYSEI